MVVVMCEITKLLLIVYLLKDKVSTVNSSLV